MRSSTRSVAELSDLPSTREMIRCCGIKIASAIDQVGCNDSHFDGAGSSEGNIRPPYFLLVINCKMDFLPRLRSII